MFVSQFWMSQSVGLVLLRPGGGLMADTQQRSKASEGGGHTVRQEVKSEGGPGPLSQEHIH